MPDFGTHTFRVTYTDNVAVDAATLDGGDILVTGPNGFSQPATLIRADGGGAGTPRTATYRITAPNGTWDAGTFGTYAVALRAGQVTDTSLNPVAPATLGTFTVDPAPWQNHGYHYDVNGDGYLTPMDVLILINSINQDGNRELPVPTKAPNRRRRSTTSTATIG